MQHFKSFSLSHKVTPLEVREKFALNEAETIGLLRRIKESTDTSELLIISTCNRTEVYFSSKTLDLDGFLVFIGLEKGIEQAKSFAQYFVSYSNKDTAIEQLYRVCVGLESQVVGDMQITNQVKRAYELSANENVAGPFLHRLMHTIFFTNKKVLQETAFRDGAASVSYVATELVTDLSSEMTKPKVLVIGAGEIGADVCRNLSDSSIEHVKIMNRTPEKADELARECGFVSIPFSTIDTSINDADIIICSINNTTPLITKKLVSKLEMLSHKYFIDLSVPRCIDQNIEDIPAVVLYNVDHITHKANSALKKRVEAIPKVEQIVHQSIDEFNNWSKEMEVSPTINKLKSALEEIRKEEISRHIKTLSKEESEAVELVTKGIMQKIIKLPVLQLKAACKRGEAETLIDVLNDLFNLENQPSKNQK